MPMYGGERRGPREFSSGRNYEYACFGDANVNDEFRAAWAKIPKTSEGRLQRLEDLYDLVRKAQTGDPKDPQKGFARDVRLAIADELELDDKAMDSLKFYTSIGTPLDLLGVDGFFEVEDETTGRRYRVTMDVTMNKGKVEDGHRADVIIGEVTDISESEEGYLREVDSYGKRIADVMRKKIEDDKANNARNRGDYRPAA